MAVQASWLWGDRGGYSEHAPVVQLPSGVHVVHVDPSEIVSLSPSVATVAFEGSPPPPVNAA